jgi:hypothetical protein
LKNNRKRKSSAITHKERNLLQNDRITVRILIIEKHMSLKSTLESSDKITYELYLTGLTEDTVRKISAEQKEPEWMLNHRLESLKIFKNMKIPTRGPDLSGLNLDDIVYYAKPHKDHEGYANNREDVPVEIKDKFKRL